MRPSAPDTSNTSEIGLIAYTKLTGGEVTGGDWNIYVTGVDSAPERQITHHPVAYELAWSPDGRRIAYPCSRYVSSAYVATLRVVDVESEEDRLVLADDVVPSPLIWTPDDRFITCLLPRGRTRDIALVAPDGTDMHVLVRGADSFSWSPDGSRLVYLKRDEANVNIELFVADGDGSDEARIAVNGLVPDSPLWSPDGQRVGFLGVTKGMGQALYVMEPNGTALRRLGEVDMDSGFAWSPDGRWLAFVAYGDEEDEGYAIRTVAVDSSQIRTLVTGINAGIGGELIHPATPAWSPDGHWIAFASYEADGGDNLYIIAPDGTNRRQLTHDTEEMFRGAAWGFSVRTNLAWRPAAREH
jgi:Tol biopolymer transport system component